MNFVADQHAAVAQQLTDEVQKLLKEKEMLVHFTDISSESPYFELSQHFALKGYFKELKLDTDELLNACSSFYEVIILGLGGCHELDFGHSPRAIFVFINMIDDILVEVLVWNQAVGPLQVSK